MRAVDYMDKWKIVMRGVDYMDKWEIFKEEKDRSFCLSGFLVILK